MLEKEANKIERDLSGCMRCTDSSPPISNNQVLSNLNYAIHLIGATGKE